MIEALAVSCLLLVAAVVGLGAWALVLYRGRAALHQQVAYLSHEFGDVALKVERLRAIEAESQRLEAWCRQLVDQRVTAERDLAAYGEEVRRQREAASAELESHKAGLARSGSRPTSTCNRTSQTSTVVVGRTRRLSSRRRTSTLRRPQCTARWRSRGGLWSCTTAASAARG